MTEEQLQAARQELKMQESVERELARIRRPLVPEKLAEIDIDTFDPVRLEAECVLAGEVFKKMVDVVVETAGSAISDQVSESAKLVRRYKERLEKRFNYLKGLQEG